MSLWSAHYPYAAIILLLLGSYSFSAKAQVPIVRNVEPINGYPGQVINIQGVNLSGIDEVRFGGVLGTVISSSDQLVEAEIPASATFDHVTVLNTTNRLEGRSRLPYAMSFGGTPGIAASDFDAQLDLLAQPGLFDICMCDLDGDGLNDIAAANSNDNNVTLFLNTSTPGNLSFSTRSILLGVNTINVSCGDLNGDQLPELVFSESDDGQRLFIFRNNSTVGTLSFSSANVTVPGNTTKRTEIHDLDRDGRPEIVVSDLANPIVSILRNTSAGGAITFAAPINVLLPGANNAASIQIADLNNDGRPDIIADQFLTTGGNLFVGINQSSTGSINFPSFTPITVSGTPVIIKIADLNRDNKPDVVYTQSLENRVSVLLNETSTGGAAAFSSPVSVFTDNSPWGLDVADYDGDGREDLLVGTLGAPTSVNILRNTSAGPTVSFSSVSIGVSTSNRNVAAGDLDGDGKPDIAIASTNNNVSILRNNKCIIPIIDPADPVNICTGNTKRLNTQKVGGATYEWRINGALQPATNSFFDVTTLSGNYAVTIISEGGACTESSSPLSVTVGASPVGYVSPTFTSPTGPVCIGGDIILEMSDPSHSYEWSGPNGFTASGQQVTVTNFRFVNSGIYEVDVINGGCTVETLSITVEAIASPEFSVVSSANAPVCQGENVTLSVSPNDAGFTYEWFDASNASVANGSSFMPTSSGNYRVRATDTVNPGCPTIESAPQRVTILTLPQANFTAPLSSCVNTPVTFQNTSTTDADGTVTYAWNFGDGGTSTQSDPVHNYVADENYTITLTVSYAGVTCNDSQIASITIQPGLNVQLTAEPEAICEGETSEIATTESFQEYGWQTGEDTPAIQADAAGTYSVTVRDVNGCTGTAEITLEAFPRPLVEVTSDVTNVAPGQPVQLNASGLVTYAWTPAELLDDPTIPDPIAAVDVPTTFEVTGEDTNGCPGSGSIQILTEGNLIGQLLDPKNFFSPNTEDNINATWTVDRILDFPQCQVTIYDQTGNILFEAQPYLNDWNGTSNGQELPTGVYYFTINCGGDDLAKTGSITLLR